MLNVYFAAPLSYYPFRENHIEILKSSLSQSLGWRYRKQEIIVFTNRFMLEDLIPNVYRTSIPVDSARIIRKEEVRPVIVRRTDEYTVGSGLSGKGIALWHSHGYFYEASLDRWEWQRAKLFGTVEDLSTMAYVLPYLTVMLENAGANVFLPRERDFQVNEVIVDNDRSTGESEVVLHLGTGVQDAAPGFLFSDTIFAGENPFRKGTAIRIKEDTASFIPDIPATGDYAVYVTWPLRADNSREVKYSVHHAGGTTDFIADQTIGGPTWIYLGTFHFRSGINRAGGSVSVSDASGTGAWVGIDAVRFGGGMGNVARKPVNEIIANQRSVDAAEPVTQVEKPMAASISWKSSGKPRYLEGARYYLQYAGMPDSLVYSPTFYKNDYNDDYMSRALWVNYLAADPGSELNNPAGLGIPLDIAFAFHTDAGVTPNDSIVGTLAIYSTATGNGLFPDSTSRMASRDMNEIIQTQIVNDIRLQFNPSWTRRGIWDRTYYEARIPNVPTMLLELLSHQNQADQVFGLDPRFRFAVSRSIYKGMLRYFAYNENRPLVVQPLPVIGFAITPAGEKRIRLSWEPRPDELETTAMPDRYRVRMRTGSGGFDNGFIVNDSYAELELETYDTVYSFKITAINAGGESLESEILSAGIASQSAGNVLIVNHFDRVSGPSWFDRAGMAGTEWWNDRGVAYKYDIFAVGDQYDFDRKSPWLDDDAPGWGASYSDREGLIMPGNTFDYPFIHGSSILKAGYSFYSVSGKYFTNSPAVPPGFYRAVDIIAGEQKTTPGFPDRSRGEFSIYTPAFMEKIIELTGQGTSIFMSGAYVGTDMQLSHSDSTAIRFAANHLRFRPRTNHVVSTGSLYATDASAPHFTGNFSFNADYSPDIYSVEAPDAIEPAGPGASTAFRYRENNTSAGIMYAGNYKTVILGFPFETITSEEERDSLMNQVLRFFENLK